jgi:ubiquinone/menaquinone biosynthesis C-methylase UbiE
MREYYDRRAREYDEWYRGTGKFAARERQDWQVELEQLIAALHALPPLRTLDVACGTGFLTRHLPGDITGLDQSAAMLEVARERVPQAIQGDALALPFPDGAFERVATGHFYGHLEPRDRKRFLAEARRVAPELLVIDSARRDGVPTEAWDPRVLNDGSRYEVFKRWFEPEQLLAELGGGDIVHAGHWFVAVRA